MNSKQARKDIFFPTVEIKDYSVMIDRKNLFDQPVKNDWVIYNNLIKIAISQGDHLLSTAICLF